ncbi:MAG TPA: bacteriohemerythrin [Candidatus Sulfotelmatobacter sp.]|nr:bacteriohemerythrin [Candidatus Sulfotelmatobacter sp.]
MVDSGSFRWTDNYKVNIATLDEQHRQLFEAVNALDLALRMGDGMVAIDQVLDKMVDYIGVHFNSEEALMEQHNFPGLSGHKAQHEMFRETIAGFLDSHRSGRQGVPVSLMLFMQTWLKTHVLKTDKLYSAFLNARGVR